MRRIKIFLCMLFALGVFCTLIPAHADISSVKYVHDTIVTLKNIDVPIPAGISASNVNNVRYLLAMIDAANYKIGNPTNYASSPAALPNVVAAAKASSDIDTLIVYPQKFYVTVSAAAAFSFKISASGTFYVDWGDGTAFQTITKPDTTQTTYSYTFKTTGAHVISIWGKATGYNTNTQIAAISFENETRAFTIAGNLGHIFPTLGDGPGLQPSFYFIFRMASGLSGQLPAGMFDGLSGTLVDYMFADIFNGTKISGTIPPNLFGDMRGGYAYGMYQSAFYNCTGLTGSIPAGLFGHLAGPAQPYIFANTFYGCTGLTGEIPAGLFGDPTGAPGINMFIGTFYTDAGLTGSIPPGLFGHLNGPAQAKMFNNTFYQCTGLTGSVPAMLFGTFTGAAQDSMFSGTFYQDRGLTSIDPGIWDLTGMTNTATIATPFQTMFQGCTSIAGVPAPTIAAGNTTNLWTKFSNMTATTIATFKNVTGLTNYANIPAGWK